MEVETIVFNKINQTDKERQISHVFSHMQNLALKNDECKTGAVPMAEGRVK
jgi:hypothetical protein